MKKMLSLVLALVMALSLTTMAWGATETVTTSTMSAQRTIASGEDVVLTADAPVTITVDSACVDAFVIEAGGKLTIGKNVTITGAGALIWVNGGELVIEGKVISTGATYGTICVSGDTAVVDVEDGAVVHSEGNSAIGIDHLGNTVPSAGAVVNVNGGTVSTAAYSALFGYTGTINVYGGEIYTENATSVALIAAGGACTVNMYGGTVESVLAHEGAGATVNISGGTVTGSVAAANGATVAISGGTFAEDVSAYLAAGLDLVQDTNGNYVAAVVPAMGDKFDLYLADAGMAAALKAKTPDVAGLSFTEVAAKTNKDGSGNVAYIAANNGQYFVKTSAPTIADFAVTEAGKNTVLYYVTVAGTSAANFAYEESVTAFANFGVKCGQVNITPVAGETYFKAADGKVYMADDAGTVYNYLLNGKVVSGVGAYTIEEHTFVINNYKYDAAKKLNVPTSAVCTKCLMSTSSIYLRTKVPATYTVCPTTGDGSVDYTVALKGATTGVYVPSAGTTPTVESAQTFDAGIAMYVGMSVMAAAGSAVVISKKKD